MGELKKILHVDDDGDILEITRLALQVVDTFELHQFPSGAAALAALPDVAPDLLLLDVMMPAMTGPELWERIRQMPGGEGIPAVFVTAKAETEMARDLKARGALDVVTKPFDPMTLGDKLRTAWAMSRRAGAAPADSAARF
jgi:CheY-like chemotaxis protein